MIKKIVLTAAIAAAAVSFASAPSFAKGKKMSKCTMGTMTTGKANSMGWGLVSGCGADGKMYPMPAMCYTASGMCPK